MHLLSPRWWEEEERAKKRKRDFVEFVTQITWCYSDEEESKVDKKVKNSNKTFLHSPCTSFCFVFILLTGKCYILIKVASARSKERYFSLQRKRTGRERERERERAVETFTTWHAFYDGSKRKRKRKKIVRRLHGKERVKRRESLLV